MSKGTLFPNAHGIIDDPGSLYRGLFRVRIPAPGSGPSLDGCADRSQKG